MNDIARKTYIAISYRVLLTRARQGMVVFVPNGSKVDTTRSSKLYDPIFEFLKECGLTEL